MAVYDPYLIYNPEQPTWDNVRRRRDNLLRKALAEREKHDRLGRLKDPRAKGAAYLKRLDQYLQILCDIPQAYTSPDAVVWPELPA